MGISGTSADRGLSGPAYLVSPMTAAETSLAFSGLFLWSHTAISQAILCQTARHTPIRPSAVSGWNPASINGRGELDRTELHTSDRSADDAGRRLVPGVAEHGSSLFAGPRAEENGPDIIFSGRMPT